MSYLKTQTLLLRHGISANTVGEIVQAYADDLEDSEPEAINSIAAARETSDGFQDVTEG